MRKESGSDEDGSRVPRWGSLENEMGLIGSYKAFLFWNHELSEDLCLMIDFGGIIIDNRYSREDGQKSKCLGILCLPACI